MPTENNQNRIWEQPSETVSKKMSILIWEQCCICQFGFLEFFKHKTKPESQRHRIKAFFEKGWEQNFSWVWKKREVEKFFFHRISTLFARKFFFYHTNLVLFFETHEVKFFGTMEKNLCRIFLVFNHSHFSRNLSIFFSPKPWNNSSLIVFHLGNFSYTPDFQYIGVEKKVQSVCRVQSCTIVFVSSSLLIKIFKFTCKNWIFFPLKIEVEKKISHLKKFLKSPIFNKCFFNSLSSFIGSFSFLLDFLWENSIRFGSPTSKTLTKTISCKRKNFTI